MFKIDGKEYNVPIEKVDRSFRKENKYEITTDDGVNHREVRAIYVDYSINIGFLDETAYYDLINDITNKKTSYIAELPYNKETITIDCDIILTGDGILVDDGVYRMWDGLSIKFESNKPLEVS